MEPENDGFQKDSPFSKADFLNFRGVFFFKGTLPGTNIFPPERLEDDCFLLGPGPFSGANC